MIISFKKLWYSIPANRPFTLLKVQNIGVIILRRADDSIYGSFPRIGQLDPKLLPGNSENIIKHVKENDGLTVSVEMVRKDLAKITFRNPEDKLIFDLKYL